MRRRGGIDEILRATVAFPAVTPYDVSRRAGKRHTANDAHITAFIESFNEIGVPVTAAETRAYMGLTKIEEIRALFNIDRVKAAFREKFGRDYTDEDVQARYVAFQRVLFDTLENYSEPIPGLL